MNKKIIIPLTVVILVIAAGFAWWQLSRRTTKPLGEPFRITMHLWPGYYHSYIAQEQGFFSDEGVNVELSLIEDIDANLKAFVDGQADAAFGLQSDAILLASKVIPKEKQQGIVDMLVELFCRFT
ncbi:MAG: ABC transporter substrate-binding protein [Thiotrichaceae bacterium]